jgi:hypothetical protein
MTYHMRGIGFTCPTQIPFNVGQRNPEDMNVVSVVPIIAAVSTLSGSSRRAHSCIHTRRISRFRSSAAHCSKRRGSLSLSQNHKQQDDMMASSSGRTFNTELPLRNVESFSTPLKVWGRSLIELGGLATKASCVVSCCGTFVCILRSLTLWNNAFTHLCGMCRLKMMYGSANTALLIIASPS